MFSDFRLPSFRTALLVYHDLPLMSTLSPDFFPDFQKFMDYFQYFTKSAAIFIKTEIAPLGNFPEKLWYNNRNDSFKEVSLCPFIPSIPPPCP